MCRDNSQSVCHSGKHNEKPKNSDPVINGTTLFNVTKDVRKNKKRRGEKSPTSEIYTKIHKVNVLHCELFRPTKKTVGNEFISDIDVSFGVKGNEVVDHPVYTCNVCERELSTKSNLKIHLSIHTDKRP